MVSRTVQVAIAFGLLGVAVGHADATLKPFQQKAKDDTLGADEVKTEQGEIAKWCGKDFPITADFSHFDRDIWKGRSPSGFLQSMLGGVVATCKDATYKGPLLKSISSLQIVVAGKGGPSTAGNLSLHGGTLVYAPDVDNANVGEEVEKFLKKQLDK